MPNPYSSGPLVKNSEMFFGRKAELHEIRTRLLNMQSTSIVGLRRIGKSSLLYQLCHSTSGQQDNSQVFLYIDLTDARCQTVTGFVEAVLRDLKGKTGNVLDLQSAKTMTDFAEGVDKLVDAGFRPVLCLDEFEKFIENPQEFNDDFLDALRALAVQSKLAMVTASRRSLANLMREGRLISQLHNIFTTIELGLLEPDPARALLLDPFKRANITLLPEADKLVEELGGRHPFYRQMVCYHLFEAMSAGAGNWPEIEKMVRERFDREAEPHLERLWIYLRPEEKAAVKAVIRQTRITKKTERTLKRLARLGLVEQADTGWQVFTGAFAKYAPKRSPRDRKLGGPEKKFEGLTAVTVILFVLMLVSLTFGALTNNIYFILFSLIPAGILLVVFTMFAPR